MTKDIRVITEDSDCLCIFLLSLENVVAESSNVCLSLRDNAVHLVDKLNIAWKGVATQDIVEHTFVISIVKNCFSTWKLSGGSQPDCFYRLLSSCLFMVFRAWKSLIILVKHNQFPGIMRVLSKANTEVFSQVKCSPSNRPDYMEQKLTSIH